MRGNTSLCAADETAACRILEIIVVEPGVFDGRFDAGERMALAVEVRRQVLQRLVQSALALRLLRRLVDGGVRRAVVIEIAGGICDDLKATSLEAIPGHD